MLDLIELTPSGGASVTAAGSAPKEQVLDALGYERMSLVLTALQLAGPLRVRVETALVLEDHAWQSLGVFTPLLEVLDSDRRTFRGILRFVRWKVEEVPEDGAVFVIAGTVS